VWQVGSVQSVTELCFVRATVQTELLRCLAVIVVQMFVGFGFLHLDDGGSTFLRKSAQHSLRRVKTEEVCHLDWTVVLLFCDQSGWLKARGAAANMWEAEQLSVVQTGIILDGLDEEMHLI
jgi:hypothetical protein